MRAVASSATSMRASAISNGASAGSVSSDPRGNLAPGIAVGDLPGSLGPTTAYFQRDGSRVLRDTRVASRAPTTWRQGR